MSDTSLAFVITLFILAGLALWVPLLHSVDSLARRAPDRIRSPDIPNLVEEDSGPHFTGEIA